ncbi:MAG: FAD-dependent oxidoreductase [Hyphomicrobiaceae bacterium]
MTNTLPDHASVVVVGGGIVGCSVLYHLAKKGVRDCTLLERNQISSGTTWHSAALVTPLRASSSGTQLAKYSASLYAGLEAETGQATGWRECGHLNIAASKDRLLGLQHSVTVARGMGVEIEIIGREEVARKWPLLRTDDLHGAAWMPASGRVNPTDVCQALLKSARANGAKVFEDTPVTSFDAHGGKIRAVETPRGRVRCDAVVNCTGLWGRSTSASAGVTAPLYACEHFYLLTETIDGIGPMLPVVRDGDAYLYIREEVGGLLVGCFEPNARPLPLEKLPAAAFALLNEDWDHFEPMMRNAIHRIPALEHARARNLINGPESFTTDHNPILGEAPEIKNFFLACGMNSSGVALAGGVGWAMAEWVTNGSPPIDLWDCDARRFLPFQNNDKILHDRIPEVLSKHFAVPWPGKDYETARGVRRSPLHGCLAARGAYFSQRGSWERAAWFQKPGVSTLPPADTFGRPSYFEEWQQEHHAAREGVAIFDQSAFSKLLIQGRDAEKFLQRVCAGDLAVPPGKVVYTPLLNARGGIESDLTITRLDQESFLAITGSGQARRDADWLRRNLQSEEHATVTDVTSAYATLSVAGPRSRDLLARVACADLANHRFPFGTAQRIDVGYGEALALRVSYAGELGWELHVASDLAVSVFESVMDSAQGLHVKLAGSHALNSLRLEKAFRSWGHDVGPTDTPLEAGLMFAVKIDKGAEFVGREAVLRKREKGYARRLVSFVFERSDAFPHGHEPIYHDGRLCGVLSSASYGHTVARPIGMGWITLGDLTDEAIVAAPFQVEIAGKGHAVKPSLRALYDPGGQRMRS